MLFNFISGKSVLQNTSWLTSSAKELLLLPRTEQGGMVVYGVSGTHNDVASSIFDRAYVIQGGKLLMETGHDMNKQALDNLPDPSFNFQAATKKYVEDSCLLKSGGTLTGDVNAGGNKITNLPTPSSNSDAATKSYVDISGLLSILSSATANYVDGYIKRNAECLYLCERELKTEVLMSPSSRAITNQSTLSRRP